MRAVGVRELVAGVGIFSDRRPAQWVWARVAGDTMDLALLGSALRSTSRTPDAPNPGGHGSRRRRVRRRRHRRRAAQPRVRRRPATAPRRPSRSSPCRSRRRSRSGATATSCYAFWRDFDHFPELHDPPRVGPPSGDGRAPTGRRGPAGPSVEWDAEIIEDVPNERIAWRSIHGSKVANSGTVRFARPGRPGHRGPRRHALWPARRARSARRSRSCSGGAREPAQRRPAPVQADARDRRDRAFRRLARGPTRPAASSSSARRTRCPTTSSRRGEHRRRRHESDRLVGPQQVRSRTSPIRRSSTLATRSCRSPRPRSAARICISTTATSRRCARATSSATSSWARSSRSAPGSANLKVGDRVVVPFPIACGACSSAAQAVLAVRQLQPERLDGREDVRSLARRDLRLLAPHRRLRGRTGRVRARAVRRRRPAQDRPRPDDEQVLFLSDIFPTGCMAAEQCDIQPGDVIAVWGCGPVGQFAIASASCSAPSA